MCARNTSNHAAISPHATNGSQKAYRIAAQESPSAEVGRASVAERMRSSNAHWQAGPRNGQSDYPGPRILPGKLAQPGRCATPQCPPQTGRYNSRRSQAAFRGRPCRWEPPVELPVRQRPRPLRSTATSDTREPACSYVPSASMVRRKPRARHSSQGRTSAALRQTHSGPLIIRWCCAIQAKVGQKPRPSAAVTIAAVSGPSSRMNASSGTPRRSKRSAIKRPYPFPLQRRRRKIARQQEEESHEIGLVCSGKQGAAGWKARLRA